MTGVWYCSASSNASPGAAVAALDVGRREHDALGVARAAVHREIEVRLLGLGRHAGGRAAALRDEDHARAPPPSRRARSSRSSARGPAPRWRSPRARRHSPPRSSAEIAAISSSVCSTRPPCLGRLRRQHLEDRGRRRDRIAEEGLDAWHRDSRARSRGCRSSSTASPLLSVGAPSSMKSSLKRPAPSSKPASNALDVALGDRRRLALELAGDGLVKSLARHAVQPGDDSRAPPCCAIWRRWSRAPRSRASAGRRAAGAGLMWPEMCWPSLSALIGASS